MTLRLSVCLSVYLSVCLSVPSRPPWWDHPRNFVNIEDTDSKRKLKYSLGQNATFVPEWNFLYDAPFSSYGPKCTKNDPFCMEVARQNARYWSKKLLDVFLVPYGGKKSISVWWWDGLLACYRPKYTQNCLFVWRWPNKMPHIGPKTY